jgi:hypothetical protein
MVMGCSDYGRYLGSVVVSLPLMAKTCWAMSF